MGDRRPVEDVQPFAELSRSATTVVYKGYQQSLDRFVLLKRLRTEASLDSRIVQRFQEEARLIARVQHPNVVAIHSYGEDDVSAYLVAEYLEGPDLAALLERGPLPVELAVFILREAVRGLGAAHERNIVHRDVKPANILVSIEGQVKVSDFGMASFVLDEVEAGGELRGTVPYLAPEQVRGMAPTPSTDLFSLGATFYEMLLGRRAFLGQSTSDIFEAILHYDPIPALAARTSIPAEAVALCGKLLTRLPEDRYASWREVDAEATAFLERLDRRIRPHDLATYVTEPANYRGAVLLPQDVDAIERTNGSVAAHAEPADAAEYQWLVPAFILMIIALTMVIVQWDGTGGAESAGADGNVADVLARSTRYPLELYPNVELDGEGAEEDAPAQVRPRLLERRSADAAETRSGWIRLDVEPWAVVIADNDTIGRTPLAYPILRDAGVHRLVFLHPDFPAHQRQVEVRPGETTDLRVSLWDSVGRVTLEVSPWAAVWIDGLPRDTIPPQSRPIILPPGEHTIRLHHPVLGEYQNVFRIRAGQAATLRYNLYELLPQ